jgi:RND family efflux transporter MFP subunit
MTTQTTPDKHEHHISPGKVILVVLILAAVIGAVALGGYLPRKQREEAANSAAREEKTSLPRVAAAKVRRAPAEAETVLPGSISALVEAGIYARASGYVKKRYVDIGDRVKQGQLLADIEVPELDQQVAQAKAALSQARQQLGQAKASLLQAQSQRDLAKLTSDRYSSLVVRGAVARMDADTQLANYKTSEALVAAQESNVGASEENVRQAQANLDRVTALQEFKQVRAPFAGVVTSRNVEAGALISASGGGQGGNTSNAGELYRIAQSGTVRILESVPQSSALGIAPGMAADVTVVEFPGRKFPGKVARTSNALDPASRTMLVEVHVPNADGTLVPGMYSEVHFKTVRPSPPFLVPGDAFIAANSGPQLALLQETPDAPPGARKIHLQPVSLGRDFGLQTEVVGGLDGSELVVLNPGDEVREGAFVKFELSGQGRGAAPGRGADKAATDKGGSDKK